MTYVLSDHCVELLSIKESKKADDDKNLQYTGTYIYTHVQIVVITIVTYTYILRSYI